MKIEKLRVQNYKCIEDSGWVDLEQVTCFVGKNESGKTAFLQAIQKLNPVDSTGEYTPLEEYPRKRYTEYKRRHEKDPDPVATARYKLTEKERSLIESHSGEGVLNQPSVEVTKDYKNNYHWEISVDEQVFVSNLLEDYELPSPTKKSLEGTDSLTQLSKKLDDSEAESEDTPALRQRVEEIISIGLSNHLGNEYLLDEQPNFLYFDEYSIMDGDVHITKLQQRENKNNLSEADKTFLSLLSLANLSIDDIRKTDDYEEITAELEAASNYISDQVFEYWTQGPNLRVEFDDSQEYPNPDGRTSNQTKQPVIHVRIKNQRHQVTLPFDDRSQGFVWFFSFMAYFSGVAEEREDLILLLDEPGLNLHAKAQHDFVRFINDRLSPEHPVYYTTHSPFMLEPKRLNRARLVIDDYEDDSGGTKISEDILESDDDTIFPLQAVLGYDLIQTLLLGPECLLVEGKSDMVFLQVMSDVLDELDRTPLSHRWTIVPVNGADNVPTFVSLFGASDLEIGVLLDDDSRISQRLEEIEDRRILDMENVKTVGEYVDSGEGDTEDLFENDLYVELVEDAYYQEINYDTGVPSKIDLDTIDSQHPRITRQIEIFFEEHGINDGRFSHHKPATHLQRHRTDYIEKMNESTLNRFETLFTELNQILS